MRQTTNNSHKSIKVTQLSQILQQKKKTNKFFRPMDAVLVRWTYLRRDLCPDFYVHSNTVFHLGLSEFVRLSWLAYLWEGLSARGAYMRAKKARETTDLIKQNENLYLKKWRKCIVLFVYLLIKENLYLKSYLSNSKIGINTFMGRAYACGGLYEGRLMLEGTLMRGVTRVLRKWWA